jgi:hypothetical protein
VKSSLELVGHKIAFHWPCHNRGRSWRRVLQGPQLSIWVCSEMRCNEPRWVCNAHLSVSRHSSVSSHDLQFWKRNSLSISHLCFRTGRFFPKRLHKSLYTKSQSSGSEVTNHFTFMSFTGRTGKMWSSINAKQLSINIRVKNWEIA